MTGADTSPTAMLHRVVASLIEGDIAAGDFERFDDHPQAALPAFRPPSVFHPFLQARRDPRRPIRRRRHVMLRLDPIAGSSPTAKLVALWSAHSALLRRHGGIAGVMESLTVRGRYFEILGDIAKTETEAASAHAAVNDSSARPAA